MFGTVFLIKKLVFGIVLFIKNWCSDMFFPLKKKVLKYFFYQKNMSGSDQIVIRSASTYEHKMTTSHMKVSFVL